MVLIVLFLFQGQFGYGSEDLWVNDGAGFGSSNSHNDGHNNNNAYFVQVSPYS